MFIIIALSLVELQISLHKFGGKTCRDKTLRDQGVDGIASEISDCGVISTGLR